MDRGFKRVIHTACLLLSLNTLHAQAETLQAVTEHLPPYQFLQPDGKLDGYSAEVLNELTALTGDTLAVRVMPWARAYQTALREKNILIFSIARNQVREANFIWLGQLLHENLYVWALKTNIDKPFKSLDELRPHTLAITRQTPPEQFFTQRGFTELHRVVRPTQNVDMLFHGRVDMIISTERTLKKRVTELGYDFNRLFKAYALGELSNGLYFAFNRDSDPALVSRYQRAFEQLENQGRLTQLREKWQLSEH